MNLEEKYIAIAQCIIIILLIAYSIYSYYFKINTYYLIVDTKTPKVEIRVDKNTK